MKGCVSSDILHMKYAACGTKTGSLAKASEKLLIAVTVK